MGTKQLLDGPPVISLSYIEARRAFLEASSALGCAHRSFKNTGVKGIEGEPLFCDVASIGARDAPYCLILTSGVHGIEGYCGSALQSCLARQIFPKTDPASVRIMLVHALNPFGFSHGTRVTEGNVDLNRNFVESFDKAAHGDSMFLAHRDHVFPTQWANSDLADIQARIERFVAENGEQAFQSWMTSGQYSFPDDPYFGGREKTWSREIWEQICAEELSPGSEIVHIDFHTGLGPFGECEIIFVGQEQTPSFAKAAGWFGREQLIPAGGIDSATPDVSGPMAAALLKRHPDAVSVAFEFGTLPLPEMLRSLVSSNWLRHNPDCDPELRQSIQAQVRAAFCSDDPQWIERVWCLTRNKVGHLLSDIGA